ncbi:MTH1187 family thiamine-binding protein [Cohnella luojiensis]|uniref:MTH1187 family thiamine-binding protein n=1 Tax=Cohnella luojiensis TaxID=652876 RepID=A0A4Y8LUR2_9BACL|nr:MTH1187 family thiamine-binding protein [Cohnella luojiensis]TFE22672.1 MTH1187 family thiamine-binding protein [Cohnella luojiensis]
MAIVQVTIVPLGTGTPSVGEYVAKVHQVLMQSEDKIKYQLTPMSTIIEGELDDLLAVVRQMHEVPFEHGAMRVSTSITIDDRRDKKGTMEQKLLSVEEKLK